MCTFQHGSGARRPLLGRRSAGANRRYDPVGETVSDHWRPGASIRHWSRMAGESAVGILHPLPSGALPRLIRCRRRNPLLRSCAGGTAGDRYRYRDRVFCIERAGSPHPTVANEVPIRRMDPQFHFQTDPLLGGVPRRAHASTSTCIPAKTPVDCSPHFSPHVPGTLRKTTRNGTVTRPCTACNRHVKHYESKQVIRFNRNKPFFHLLSV